MLEILADQLKNTALSDWAKKLPSVCSQRLSSKANGNVPRWQEAIDSMPALAPRPVEVESGPVSIGRPGDADEDTLRRIECNLHLLHPWRKGPYLIHGIPIDTEWRSDLKWDRLKDRIRPLEQRLVLDVGCGNGYHCWRMKAAGARLVVGIDPSPLFAMQFRMVRSFTNESHVHVLPIGIEEMPGDVGCFDTVFSMGVLYHRRSPFDHLLELKGLLRSGGELVLETLVVEGKKGEVLVPEGRYGKMRNVWFIPSPDTLVSWLKRCGFRKVELVDTTPTTIKEQRSTDWMLFESLPDFLDENNPAKTIEGYPAPIRSVFLAEAP
ncbi:MAG: tRNA 5-methoxyuridine(34)/uridine 5-oxyacetic acid(34) synthase CmoB [Proteobacteria bacterium]|nr:tRNA 5-methoxyuridine(34)/uridine 5-oxyacetic acid(34) synthase CmoB [Pseudomonadota bacterium]